MQHIYYGEVRWQRRIRCSRAVAVQLCKIKPCGSARAGNGCRILIDENTNSLRAASPSPSYAAEYNYAAVQ